MTLHCEHPVNVNAAQGLVLNVLARMGGFDSEYLRQHLRGPDNEAGTGDDPWLTNFEQIPGFGAGPTPGGANSSGNLFGATSQMFRIEVKVARGESVFLIDTLVGPKGGPAALIAQLALHATSRRALVLGQQVCQEFHWFAKQVPFRDSAHL